MSVTATRTARPPKDGLQVSDLSAGLFGAYGFLRDGGARAQGERPLVDNRLLEATVAPHSVERDRVMG